MKRSFWVVILIVVAVAAVIFGMQALAKRAGGAYKLAEQMKAQGLNYEKVRLTGSTGMYEELSLEGTGILVKTSRFGNGLFLKHVKDNLAKDKKDRKATEPVYAAGAYIVVVYKEPVNGMVKGIMLKYFPEVEEY